MQRKGGTGESLTNPSKVMKMSDIVKTLKNRAEFFHNPDYVRAGFPGYLIEPLSAELMAAADELERLGPIVYLREDNGRLVECHQGAVGSRTFREVVE